MREVIRATGEGITPPPPRLMRTLHRSRSDGRTRGAKGNPRVNGIKAQGTKRPGCKGLGVARAI